MNSENQSSAESEQEVNLNVKYWNVGDDIDVFPEQSGDDPYVSADRVKQGICFSGGGTVSMALIAGYLDALSELGLISQIGYISGVSGGTWGTAPFLFNSDSALSSGLCGKHMQPQDLTVDEIKSSPPSKTLADVSCNAPIGGLTAAYGLSYKVVAPEKAHEAYSDAVGQMFLQPFDIDSPNVETKPLAKGITNPLQYVPKVIPNTIRKWFTLNSKSLTDIKSRNAALTETQFMYMPDDAPFYIMNTTMLGPDQKEGSFFNVLPFEFTPLYSGMRYHTAFNYKKDIILKETVKVGGFYVETLGFDATASAINSGTAAVSTKRPFELCLPVGTSGSAIGKKIADLPFYSPFKLAELFLPKFNYWNPNDLDDEHKPKNHMIDFGDGGILENTGIPPLLARNVAYIAAFVSQMTMFIENGKPAVTDVSVHGWSQLAFGYNQIACLFGAQLIDTATMNHAYKKDKSKANMEIIWISDPADRQVFETTDPAASMDQVMTQLREANLNGGPTSVDLQLQVCPNFLFGIKGGYTVNLKLTHLGTCTNWQKQLPSDVLNMIGEESTGLNYFPNIKTFNENPEKGLISLEPAQVNMLGNLAYWIVMDQQEAYKSLLTGHPFPSEP